jgi:hypothetical protein
LASAAESIAALASKASGQRGHSLGARAGHSPESGSSARVRKLPASSDRGPTFSRQLDEGWSTAIRVNTMVIMMPN